MVGGNDTWALVLAAGDGSRLRSLTTAPSGATIPKQFCSLRDGPLLLEEAVRRASTVASVQFTCAVVAEQHRRWWEPVLWPLAPPNVFVQPENRGTAIGILLPLLHIVERDPHARLIVLPSDHFVRDEAVLARAMRRAAQQPHGRRGDTLLLGLEPEQVDPDLGYIVPRRGTDRAVLEIARFVAKPSASEARGVVKGGALWNAFIVAASARALLDLFRQRIACIESDLHGAVRQDLRAGSGSCAAAELYDRLPIVDFSRDILQGQEALLRVLRVPRCGWSDLGTALRVARALRQTAAGSGERELAAGMGHRSLAAQLQRLDRAAAMVRANAA